VSEEKPLIEQAIDALRHALTLPHGTERWVLLDEALRLNRLSHQQNVAPRDAAPATPSDPAIDAEPAA